MDFTKDLLEIQFCLNLTSIRKITKNLVLSSDKREGWGLEVELTTKTNVIDIQNKNSLSSFYFCRIIDQEIQNPSYLLALHVTIKLYLKHIFKC